MKHNVLKSDQHSEMRNLILILTTFLTLTAAAKTDQQQTVRQKLVQQNIFPIQDKHVHSSSIAELPNGDLLSCWFEGSGERKGNDVMIKGARLKKGHPNWSEPFVMADTPNNPDCNPLLFLDKENRLHLIWVVVVANRWESSILKTRISTDYTDEGAPKWDWQDIILLKPGEEFTETLEKQFIKDNDILLAN